MAFLTVLVGPPRATAAEPIRIGIQAPLTGAWSDEGEMAVNAVEIVAEQINSNGGIGGQLIELVVEDDKSSPDAAVLAAQRLIDEEVVAVIGSYASSVTERSAPVYERVGVLNIAYASTAVSLTGHGYEYFFRTNFRDDRQGDFFAELAGGMGLTRVAVLHDNTTFAKGLAEAARDAIDADERVEIVFYDAVNPGASDYSSTLADVQNSLPVAVYYTGYYPEAGIIARQMDEMGMTAFFIGGNAAVNQEFVDIAGTNAAAGTLVTQEPLATDLPYDEAEAFVESYVSLHGEPPSTPWPAYAADALTVIATAIEELGTTDSAMLANYLRTDLHVDGITGPISFEESGDRSGAIYQAYQVNAAGRLVLIEF